MVKSQFTEYFNKKLFFFSYPHTLTIRLKRPVYRAFSGEGKREGLRAKKLKLPSPGRNAPMSFPNTNRTNNTNLFRLQERYIR